MTMLSRMAMTGLESRPAHDPGTEDERRPSRAGAVGLDPLVEALRALAEPTRARIIALLRHGECSVSDLCEILGQSQPGISRHLRQLHDAGLVSRHREGSFVFFGLRSDGGGLAAVCREVLDTADPTDPTLADDRRRLDEVRERRADLAHDHFAAHADDWDRERAHSAPDELVLPVVVEMLAESGDGLGRVLDIGTGTGRMVQLLAPAAARMVGLDPNHTMLRVARANLDRSGIHHVELRQGDVFRPPFAAGEFDLVVSHQVLHFLDDADRAVAEMARLLDSNGRLLIVDLPPHDVEQLRRDHAHRRLGFSTSQIAQWVGQAGLELIDERCVGADDQRLPSMIWLASRPAPPSETQ